MSPRTNSEGKIITGELMRALEEDRKTLTVIVAGYIKEIREQWLSFDEGLASRFQHILEFEDFDMQDLRGLFVKMVRDLGWKLEIIPPDPRTGKTSDVASVAARRLFRSANRRGFANARSVRNMVEAAQRRANTRLRAQALAGHPPTAIESITLTRRDVLPEPVDPDQSSAFKTLLNMVGLASVKENFRDLANISLRNFVLEEAGREPLKLSLHQVFLGNAGTGKTEVAKLYGSFLKEMGLLSDGEVIVIGASALVGDSIGAAGTKVNQLLDVVQQGKILLIDEAYVLHESIYGKQALDVLVERVQGTPGEDFVVLLCGYEDKMKEMLSSATSNQGLASRFKLSDAFYFDDYSDGELSDILISMAKKEYGLTLSKSVARAAVTEVLAKRRAKIGFGYAICYQTDAKNTSLSHDERVNTRSRRLSFCFSGLIRWESETR